MIVEELIQGKGSLISGKNRYDLLMQKNFLSLISLVLISILFSSQIKATVPSPKPAKVDWSFRGPFGTFDRAELQRGFQVYKEVCSVCHGLNLLRYDKLTALGFSTEEIKAIAGADEVPGPLNEDGESTTKKADPGDHFAKPYTNEKIARAANSGALPPDLSLITKARLYGADYVYAILVGYSQVPDEFNLMPGMYYNIYFDGQQIAMPAPLTPSQVIYSDGTKATVRQMAHDVTAFLAWAAEPELEYRRQLGIKVMIYLFFFTLIMYCLMRQTWKKIKE